MLRSLHSRLLFSYLGIIAVVLFILAVALIGFAASPQIRLVPALQQLAAVSSAFQSQLARLDEQAVDAPTLRARLEQVAADAGVRIVITRRSTQQIVYDTQSEDSWLGLFIRNVSRPNLRLAQIVGGNALIGSFGAPDGSSWLVYARPTPETSRLLVFFAIPEPTPRGFFADYFARPLFWSGVAAFLVALLLAYWITRSVSRPLRRMADASEALAGGDYDQELTPAGPEEVRRLARSFNHMAAQVQRSREAQQDFVANVSHDLKTPITSIRGWSQALLDDTAATPDEQKRAAGIIHAEAARMARMVAQLLDLERAESGLLELAQQPVDLRQIVVDVHQSLLPRARDKAITFTLDAPPLPAIVGDWDRLTQVVTNLVENAIDYTDQGGRVHLGGRAAGARGVDIVVEDNGRGISAEELPRLFERFYQVDKSRARDAGGRRGSGLGLAIVKELVEAHQGRIDVDSEAGQGSTFRVWLPTRAAAALETR